MSDYKIERPLGKIVDIRPQLDARRDPVPFVFTPDERRAIDREERMLCEIAELHRTVGYMRARCEEALKDCCHPGSVQALALKDAIEKAGEL